MGGSWTSAPPPLVGYALWLEPDGELRAQLAALILALARQFGTEPFAPHVTLLGEIARGEAETRALAAQAAASSLALSVDLVGVGAHNHFYRCLSLEVAPSADLQGAYVTATSLASMAPAHPFAPHVSLIYGDLDPHAKRVAADLIQLRLPLRFRAAGITVVDLAGGPSEWQRLTTFPFRPSPA